MSEGREGRKPGLFVGGEMWKCENDGKEGGENGEWDYIYSRCTVHTGCTCVCVCVSLEGWE